MALNNGDYMTQQQANEAMRDAIKKLEAAATPAERDVASTVLLEKMMIALRIGRGHKVPLAPRDVAAVEQRLAKALQELQVVTAQKNRLESTLVELRRTADLADVDQAEAERLSQELSATKDADLQQIARLQREIAQLRRRLGAPEPIEPIAPVEPVPVPEPDRPHADFVPDDGTYMDIAGIDATIIQQVVRARPRKRHFQAGRRFVAANEGAAGTVIRREKRRQGVPVTYVVLVDGFIEETTMLQTNMLRMPDDVNEARRLAQEAAAIPVPPIDEVVVIDSGEYKDMAAADIDVIQDVVKGRPRAALFQPGDRFVTASRGTLGRVVSDTSPALVGDWKYEVLVSDVAGPVDMEQNDMLRLPEDIVLVRQEMQKRRPRSSDQAEREAQLALTLGKDGTEAQMRTFVELFIDNILLSLSKEHDVIEGQDPDTIHAVANADRDSFDEFLRKELLDNDGTAGAVATVVAAIPEANDVRRQTFTDGIIFLFVKLAVGQEFVAKRDSQHASLLEAMKRGHDHPSVFEEVAQDPKLGPSPAEADGTTDVSSQLVGRENTLVMSADMAIRFGKVFQKLGAEPADPDLAFVLNSWWPSIFDEEGLVDAGATVGRQRKTQHILASTKLDAARFAATQLSSVYDEDRNTEAGYLRGTQLLFFTQLSNSGFDTSRRPGELTTLFRALGSRPYKMQFLDVRRYIMSLAEAVDAARTGDIDRLSGLVGDGAVVSDQVLSASLMAAATYGQPDVVDVLASEAHHRIDVLDWEAAHQAALAEENAETAAAIGEAITGLRLNQQGPISTASLETASDVGLGLLHDTADTDEDVAQASLNSTATQENQRPSAVAQAVQNGDAVAVAKALGQAVRRDDDADVIEGLMLAARTGASSILPIFAAAKPLLFDDDWEDALQVTTDVRSRDLIGFLRGNVADHAAEIVESVTHAEHHQEEAETEAGEEAEDSEDGHIQSGATIAKIKGVTTNVKKELASLAKRHAGRPAGKFAADLLASDTFADWFDDKDKDKQYLTILMPWDVQVNTAAAALVLKGTVPASSVGAVDVAMANLAGGFTKITMRKSRLGIKKENLVFVDDEYKGSLPTDIATYKQFPKARILVAKGFPKTKAAEEQEAETEIEPATPKVNDDENAATGAAAAVPSESNKVAAELHALAQELTGAIADAGCDDDAWAAVDKAHDWLNRQELVDDRPVEDLVPSEPWRAMTNTLRDALAIKEYDTLDSQSWQHLAALDDRYRG